MENTNLLEKLAELEHIQWVKWAKSIYPEVSLIKQKRWKKFFCPYEQLEEQHKEVDREWARKVLVIIDGYKKE